MKYNRRDFLKFSGTTVACACLGEIFLNSCSPLITGPQLETGMYHLQAGTIIVFLNKISELSRIGGFVTIDDDRLNPSLIIARTGEENYVAASNFCTHNGKPLNYDHAEKLYRCIGRKSAFTLDGSVVRGPAEKPLKIFSSYVETDRLVIDLSG